MRHLFITNAVTDEAGNVLRSRAGSVYATEEAALAGTPALSDLQDGDQNTITAPVTNGYGNAIFYGPDDISEVWISFGYGVWYLPAADLAPRLNAVESEIALLAGQPVIVRSNVRPADTSVIWLSDPNAPSA